MYLICDSQKLIRNTLFQLTKIGKHENVLEIETLLALMHMERCSVSLRVRKTANTYNFMNMSTYMVAQTRWQGCHFILIDFYSVDFKIIFLHIL